MSKTAAFALILLPASLGFLFVRSFGVNVAYGDQWRIAQLFGKLSSGTLSFADLWNQLNEHRIFLPRIVMLSLGSLTRWNNVAEMYATQALLLLVLLVLLIAFRRGVGSGLSGLIFFVPVAFLVFSFRQAETMLMGLLMQFALVLAFAVLAFYCLHSLDRGPPRTQLAFTAAIVSGTLASLSSAHGLLVWPVGLLQIVVGPAEKRAKWSLGVIWGTVGVGEWVVYFLGYHTPDRAAPDFSGEGVAGMLYYGQFFLTLMGSSLTWWPGPALAMGALLLVLVTVAILLVLRGGELGELSFFVALMLFAFVVLLSITVGRAALGSDQALVSRYATYSILGIAGLYGVLARLCLERRSRLAIAAFAALLGAVVLSLPAAFAEGIEVGRTTKETREEAAHALATYESQPDGVLAAFFGNPQVVRKRAPELEKLGLNVFSESENRIEQGRE